MKSFRLPGWKGDPYAIGISLLSLVFSSLTFSVANIYHRADISALPRTEKSDFSIKQSDNIQSIDFSFKHKGAVTIANNGTTAISVEKIVEYSRITFADGRYIIASLKNDEKYAAATIIPAGQVASLPFDYDKVDNIWVEGLQRKIMVAEDFHSYTIEVKLEIDCVIPEVGEISNAAFLPLNQIMKSTEFSGGILAFIFLPDNHLQQIYKNTWYF